MDFYLLTVKSDIFLHFDAISLVRFFSCFLLLFFHLKAFCNSIMNLHQKFNTLNSIQFLFNVFLMMCYVLTSSSFDFHFLLLLSEWADFKGFIEKKAPSTELGGGRRSLLPRRACTIKLLLHLPQNIQIIGQYLKFDNIYAFAKIIACSSVKVLTWKRALILLFALQQIFSIWLLKFIFLSNVTFYNSIRFKYHSKIRTFSFKYSYFLLKT